MNPMREIRDNAICHPERKHKSKGMCSICAQKYYRRLRNGEAPPTDLARIVACSGIRALEGRRVAAQDRAARTEARRSQKRVREVFDYDPETGLLRRRTGRRSGLIAGSKSTRYLVVEYDGAKEQQHRVIWLWMTGQWPTMDIDHRDGDSLNNRWTNLREATRSQNMQNAALQKRSRSGFKNVNFHPLFKKWRARITIDGKRKSLGCFDTKEQAHEAYAKAAREHYGEFARVA